MSEVYKIGVSLMMSSNASGVLKLLGAEILGVHAKLKDLNKGLLTTEGNIARLNRIKLAVGGGVMMGAGIGLISGLKHVTDHARELSHELVQLQKMNIGSTEKIPLANALDEVQKKAKAVAEEIKGITRVDALKAYGSAYSIFGHHESIGMMAPMLSFAKTAGNTGGNYDRAFESLYSMVRAGDLSGQLTDPKTGQASPEKLKHFLDLGSKVMLGTHGKVDAATWLALAQQGGPALSGMSDQGLYTMAIAAQAMGGPRAGTALTSLYQQMVGGKMTDTVYGALKDIGLAHGHYEIGRGGKKKLVREGVDQDFQARLKDDPITAVQMMQEQMRKHGLDTIEKQVPVLFEILGRQTTQRLVHDLLRNMPQILGERERTKNALGVDASKGLQDQKDYTQAEQNLKKAWEDLMQAVAGPNSQTAINIMNMLTDKLRGFTKAVDGIDPSRIEAIGKGLLALSAVLTVGGGLMILGPVGTIVVGLTAAVIAFSDQITAVMMAIAPLSAKLEEFKTAAYAGITDFVPKLVAEIASWPGRVGEAIAGMGSAIVDKFKNLLSKNPLGKGLFGDAEIQGGSFNGAGAGATIHRTSLDSPASPATTRGTSPVPVVPLPRRSASYAAPAATGRALEPRQAAGLDLRSLTANLGFTDRAPSRTIHQAALAAAPPSINVPGASRVPAPIGANLMRSAPDVPAAPPEEQSVLTKYHVWLDGERVGTSEARVKVGRNGVSAVGGFARAAVAFPAFG